ncbi:hypothetical protein NTGBS_200078 [Candidatus Nitrotoga sp. BS]|uniref:hypothetical protein n=1 Tax=Candidatus Nitrotoga sp. BS TaxID=2890408 RepID=UPI001EF1AA8B|nr:hypothetical protein [Candidatus Nitrotoga sp. BS]CAH1196080.1 hypothetical protein NTGBS_200078 [Candidatus Nitrotoga sp. BS]
MEVKPLRQGSVQAGYKETEVSVIPDATLANRGDGHLKKMEAMGSRGDAENAEEKP